MDPQTQFCHNPDCPARGQVGQGNLRSQSRKERRSRCTTCGRTFVTTRDTPFSRLKKPTELVTIVVTLLGHGCPLHAIVAAFDLDERTIALGQTRVGQHSQRLPEPYVLQGQADLVHVQADELWVQRVGGKLWMALALAVASGLGLGGVLSVQRDLTWITTLVRRVRAAARSLAILVCVEGLASSVTAFTRVFRHPLHPGRRGRPGLLIEPGLLIGQVVKP
jgi:transposase-like protein